MDQMNGKLVLITGATNGIGKAAAMDLAALGADVVVVGRDETKCRETVQALPSGKGQQHRHYAADLSQQAQVRDLGQRVAADLPRLDVLLNNAGAWFSKRALSADGIEMTWALNHMNYFLLSACLLDLLKRNAERHGEARIINQASGAHHEGSMHWDDLEFARTWDTAGKGSIGPGWGVYSQSKLANVAFSLALARRLKGTGVSANAVHPGVVVTGFSQNNGLLYRIAAPLRRLGNRKTARDGAEPAVFLASSAEAKGITGKYYGPPHREETPSAQALDQALQERLWALSQSMLR